jgi:hypothetical protein
MGTAQAKFEADCDVTRSDRVGMRNWKWHNQKCRNRK